MVIVPLKTKEKVVRANLYRLNQNFSLFQDFAQEGSNFGAENVGGKRKYFGGSTNLRTNDLGKSVLNNGKFAS